MKILKESDKAIVKTIGQKIRNKIMVMEVAFKGQEEIITTQHVRSTSVMKSISHVIQGKLKTYRFFFFFSLLIFFSFQVPRSREI